MKKSICIIILIIAGYHTFAQTKKWAYGINISADWNSYVLVKDIKPFDYKGRLNTSAGVAFRYTLSERLSTRMQVNFSTKNYKENLDFTTYRPLEPDDVILNSPESVDILYKHSFIDIPISLDYTIIHMNHINFYASLGMIGSQQIGFSSESNSDFFQAADRRKYNSFLLSTKFGIGTLIKTGKAGINIEPQIRVYLNQVHQRAITENPIHFGIEFTLFKL